VESWLGRHAAVVGDPQGGKIQAVVLAETTDPAQTRAGLDRINAQQTDPKDKIFYSIQGDVAYLADSQQVADTAAKDAESDPLSSSGTFEDDLATVGDDGILSFWIDGSAADKIEGEGGNAGRMAGSLHFTDTTVDLQVRAIDSPVRAGDFGVGPRLATLPGDTAMAVGLSGADKLVRSAYEQLDKAGLNRYLERAERDSGLRFPDDIAALVGSRTVFAVGPAGDEMGIGIVSTTDDKAGAARAADTLLSKLGPHDRLTVRTEGGGVVLASSEAYADRLDSPAAVGQSLGRQELFTATMPDVGSATTAAYVNFEQRAEVADEPLPDEAKALRSFGLTAANTKDGTTLHLRLVAG
jgi:hypothetical protein